MKRLLLLTVLFLSGCAGTPAVSHYQSCNTLHGNLTEVLACGKKARNESCLAANNCSSDGDLLVAFFDRLNYQLETNQISPHDARLVYANKIRDAEREIWQAQQDFADAMGKAGRETMNTWGGGNTSPSQSTGYLSHQEVSGLNRICYYKGNGGKKALNVKSTEICPVSYVF
jgi:hypothetical protein